jgi:hypothetical protein
MSTKKNASTALAFLFWEPITWLSIFFDGGYQAVESDLAARPAVCRLRLAFMAGIDCAPDQIPHQSGWVLICISSTTFPLAELAAGSAPASGSTPWEADDLPEVKLLVVSG